MTDSTFQYECMSYCKHCAAPLLHSQTRYFTDKHPVVVENYFKCKMCNHEDIYDFRSDIRESWLRKNTKMTLTEAVTKWKTDGGLVRRCGWLKGVSLTFICVADYVYHDERGNHRTEYILADKLNTEELMADDWMVLKEGEDA